MLKKLRTHTHTSEVSTQTITQPTSETGSQTTSQEPNDDTQMEESKHQSTSTTVCNQLPANIIIDSNKEIVVSVPTIHSIITTTITNLLFSLRPWMTRTRQHTSHRTSPPNTQ